MIKRLYTTLFGIFLTLLISFSLTDCTSDNPDPTGLFEATFTGDFTGTFSGTARFRLEPNGNTGLIIIELQQSANEYIRIVKLNPNPTQIILDPGTYTIVPQLGNDIQAEVLVDFINIGNTFTASSGEVQIGISKPDQISGNIVSAEFNFLKSMCNASFDSTPE